MKRQLNVQEQNELLRDEIRACALAFRNGASRTDWVRTALSIKRMDLNSGILADVASTPCGGAESTGYAYWVTVAGVVYAIEATVTLSEDKFISLDEFRDATSEVGSGVKRGTGKTLGMLAAEVISELFVP